jgi:hypothetical protein
VSLGAIGAMILQMARSYSVAFAPNSASVAVVEDGRGNAMLESLHLKNVGPAPEMKLELAPRLNLITGDNGLGKSFLLEVAWWALTGRWPQELNPRLTSGYLARPKDLAKPASIRFRLQSRPKPVEYESQYQPREEAWRGKSGRPSNPGLVLYAHADGGFSVWDPARNYWTTRGNLDVQDRLPGYAFSPRDVWDGLRIEGNGTTKVPCNGLLADWAGWVREDHRPWPDRRDSGRRPPPEAAQHYRTRATLDTILRELAPPGEILKCGPLRRISVDDARDIPTLHTAYGEVAIVHASAGIRRAAGLAYMLMWSWYEHVQAAQSLGESATQQVTVLFDEIESHLHPRWQRHILGALLKVVEILHREASVQLISTTHSPLVMASAEPFFDASKDAWFDLDLEEGTNVVLHKRTFERQGEVANWLTSVAFDLEEARSVEAETAIREALTLARQAHEKQSSPSESEIERVDQLLRASLGEVDRFWLRWTAFRESHPPSAKAPRQIERSTKRSAKRSTKGSRK